MKKILIAVILVGGTSTAFAQSTQNRSSASVNTTISVTIPDGPTSGLEQRAQNEADRLSTMLDLNEEQKAKVKAITLETETELDRMRSSAATSSPERAKHLLTQRDEQYKTVFTPAQNAKYEQLNNNAKP